MIITPALLPVKNGKPVNHSKGRQGHRVRALVIHVSEGSLSSMTNWFNNPAAKASAHYAVARDGRVLQYVDDADTAWHAGKKVRPSAPLVLEIGGNPNDYTIGIEHEGKADQQPTEKQLISSAELIAHLSKKHNIPLEDRFVIPHRKIRADKTCPGKISTEGLITLALKIRSPRPQPGDRRWSNFFEQYIILTEYTDDLNWKFVPANEERTAQTPWSGLKEKAPDA